MGQKDIALVRFFEDQGRYADLINGFVFRGKQVVSEKDVQELGSRVTGVPGKPRKRFMVQKYQDCVRRVVLGMNIVVVGIENQDKVHYGMPVRVMMEDATDYDRQPRQTRRFRRRERDLRGDEFSSGFAREDKIYPALTICIHYGSKPYNGARELYGMTEYQNLLENLKYMLSNYRIQVLEIGSLEDIDCFKTDLREVFGFIQCAGDKEAEGALTFENEEKFELTDEDALDVITVLTGSAELESVKDVRREEGGKVNMCEAIKGMIEDGREEGEREKAYKIAGSMYIRGFPVPETASFLEESLETVTARYEEWARKQTDHADKSESRTEKGRRAP